jgi:DNA-directed RNA polymerase specialized sigma24 family protein
MPSRTGTKVKPKHPRGVTTWEATVLEYNSVARTFAFNTHRQLPGWDVEDVEQEMLMVLWKCWQKYDPDKGASFNTLFQGCARNKCITLVRTVNTMGRKGVALSLEEEAVRYAAEDARSYMSVEDIVVMNCELNLLYTPEEIERAVRPDRTARSKAQREGRLAS